MNLLKADRVVEAWQVGLRKLADDVATEIAAKAAKEFEAKLKTQLVGSLALFLERTIDMRRDDEHLIVTIRTKEAK